MNYCVYKILSKEEPSKHYIGRTFSTEKRFSQHLLMLGNNSHHSSNLQEHYNLHGEDDIVFKVLESELTKEESIKIEQIYLDKENPYFNMSANSRGGRSPNEYKNISMENVINKDSEFYRLIDGVENGEMDAINKYLELRYGKPKDFKGFTQKEINQLTN